MRDSVGVATSVEQQRESAQVGGLLTALDRVSLWGLVAGLIPFAAAFAVYLFVFLEIRPDTTGDEPHYLITAESIAYDLDVDLRNDYASGERVLRVVNVFPLGPDAFVYKESGELRPFRGVGLPAVLAPAVALGGLTGARLVMVLIAALLADQLYRLLRDLRLRRRYRVLAWAAAVFCLPVLVFTSQIYPELAGALLVVVALRVMVVGASRPAALALGSSAAAALVWLHVRYFPLSLGILFGLALAACLQDWSPGVGGHGLRGTIQAARAIVVRCAVVLVKRWRTITLPVLAPYAIGFGLLPPPFSTGMGAPSLGLVRGVGVPAVGAGHWDFWYQFALRDILDPVVGWIPFAPVHWLGFAALGCLVVWFGWPAVGASQWPLAMSCSFRVVGTGVGFGLPARYPMIVVPLIAVPLAVGIQRYVSPWWFSCRSWRSRSFSPWLPYATSAAVSQPTFSRSSECAALLRPSLAVRRSGPSVLHSGAGCAAGARRRGSSKEARSSQGRVETSPGSSGSGRTSRSGWRISGDVFSRGQRGRPENRSP